MSVTSPAAAPFASPKALLASASRQAGRENHLSTLFGLVQVLMTIALAYWVAQALNAALYQAPAQLPPLRDWLLLALILSLRVLAAYAQVWSGNRASIAIRQYLRQWALSRCAALNIRLSPAFPVATITHLLSTGIDRQRGYFADYVPQQRLALLMPLAILLAALSLNWLAALILLLTAPLLVVFMVLAGWKAADASRDNLQQLNRLGDLLSDRLKNLQALQLAGATGAAAGQLFEQSEAYRRSSMSVLRLAFLSGTVLEFFSAISVAIMAVYLGLYFLGHYDAGSWAGLTLAEGVFLLMLAPEFYAPLRRLGALYHERSEAVSLAEQLLQLEALAQQASTADAVQTIPPLQQLQVQGLQCGTSGQALSFCLQPGQKLLLNGPSGTGKTTVLDTLAGLRPALAGTVQINGTACTLFRQPQWLAQVGYLSQRPELLFASIRDNLCLGRSFSDDALYAALQQAQVAEVVQALPGGLDYCISDSGGYLSGGQAQRIALARVFLHRPALLLLDEPTANLDAATAAAFMQQLSAYCADGGMLIMASHRPAEQRFFNAEITLTGGAQ